LRPLGGDLEVIDTPLEIALLSISPGVEGIRPPEANVMLPANNPRLADQRLGAAVFQEMQILRFLADTAAVSRHEAMLQWIISRGNVTRAEVEAFYRGGIRGLISETVNEEFNKISFPIRNIIRQQDSSYGGVLTRNPQNGHYTLSYGGAYTNNRLVRQLINFTVFQN